MDGQPPISQAEFFKQRARETERRREKISETGGIYLEREGETRFVNVFGTRIETAIEDEAELERILAKLNISELDEVLLGRLAKARTLSHSVMFEGDPGAGKSFSFDKFNELIEGEAQKPLVMTCTPKMSEIEIIGHWAPAPGGRSSTHPEIQAAYARFDAAKANREQRLAEFDEQIRKAGTDIKVLESLSKRMEPIHMAYQSEIAELKLETDGQVQWEFKKGFLPEAYEGNGGKGRMLVADEFNLLPSNMQQIFLQTVSHGGRISERVQLGGGPDDVYEKGENTYIAYAQNFPEVTEGRSVVAPPMTDRVEWYSIPRHLVQQKEADFIRAWGTALTLDRKEKTVKGRNGAPDTVKIERTPGKLRDPGTEFSLRNALEGDAVRVLGDRLAAFHQEYKSSLEAAPDYINGEERTQRLETSGRRAIQAMSHMETFPVIGADGKVDLEETFREAVTRQYLDRIIDPQVRGRVAQILESVLVTTGTSEVKYQGEKKTAREALADLKERYAQEEYSVETGTSLEDLRRQAQEEKDRELFEARKEVNEKIGKELEDFVAYSTMGVSVMNENLSFLEPLHPRPAPFDPDLNLDHVRVAMENMKKAVVIFGEMGEKIRAKLAEGEVFSKAELEALLKEVKAEMEKVLTLPLPDAAIEDKAVANIISEQNPRSAPGRGGRYKAVRPPKDVKFMDFPWHKPAWDAQDGSLRIPGEVQEGEITLTESVWKFLQKNPAMIPDAWKQTLDNGRTPRIIFEGSRYGEGPDGGKGNIARAMFYVPGPDGAEGEWKDTAVDMEALGEGDRIAVLPAGTPRARMNMPKGPDGKPEPLFVKTLREMKE